MFSKRRSGLFKKASELCTLCGRSPSSSSPPANKAFSFGHLEVDTVIDRFLARRPASQILEALRNNSICDLNFVLTQLLNQVEFERKNGEEIDQMRRANETKAWWESPIKGLRLGELKQLKMAMEEVRKHVVEQSNKLASKQANGMALFGINYHGSMQMKYYEEILETKPLDINGIGGNGGPLTFSIRTTESSDGGIH